MKKMMKLFSVVAVLLTVACTNNDESVNPTFTQNIRFTAEAPLADIANRAGYNSAIGAQWDANDVVYVWLNSSAPYVEFSQQEGSLTSDKRVVEYGATVTVEGDIDETVSAVYLPAQARTGKAARIVLPAEQTYVENGYTQIPLVGKATGTVADGKVTIENMAFKNYFSVLKLNLKGDVTVKKIVLSDANNAVIAGKVIVYPNNEDASVVNKWDGASNTEITLDCGSGVALNSENATAFYVVVPSQNLHDNTIFANGCNIAIHTSDGQFNKQSKAMGELAENTIYDTPALTLNAAEAKKFVPDAIFRGWLVDNGFVTAVDDATGEVTIASEYSTTMSVKNSATSGIVTFQGVEYFSALTKLELVGYSATCTDTTFDTSKMSNLKNLIVNGNNLKSLDLSNNSKLTQIYCYSNEMTELDVTMLPDALNVRAGKQSTKNGNEGAMVVYARAAQTNSSADNANNENMTWTVVE